MAFAIYCIQLASTLCVEVLHTAASTHSVMTGGRTRHHADGRLRQQAWLKRDGGNSWQLQPRPKVASKARTGFAQQRSPRTLPGATDAPSRARLKPRSVPERK